MRSTVVGFFDNLPEAQAAVQDLVSQGIPRDDISLTANNARGEYADSATDAGTGDRGNHAGSGAAAGAGIGAVLGGIGGLLVGLGALAIPGIGPIVAAGPLAAALAGAGIGAAAGGLVGALTGMGIPEEDAHTYAEGVRRGGSLVTVHADENRYGAIADILNRHGAVDVDQRAAEWRNRGWSGFSHENQPLTTEELDQERSYYSSGTTLREGERGEIRVPVEEEELAVGTRAVQRGGVRIYKHVEERPVSQDVTLTEEHVHVDRRPVDRPITADDQAFQERSYEVREMAEEPVVAKQARVTEEVVVRKDVDQRTERVSDTVRRTDVDVQPTTGGRTAVRDDDEI